MVETAEGLASHQRLGFQAFDTLERRNSDP